MTAHDSLELFVAGAGPSYSDKPGALGAAYLVRTADRSSSLLLDLGQGAFPNVAAEVPPERLLATLVSHLHPDHFIDLVSFRHYLHWQLRPPGRARVVGPAGLGDRLDALHAEPGFSAAALDIEVLRPGRLQFGPFEVDAAKVRHTDDELRVPRLDRRRRARLLGGLWARGGPRTPHPTGGRPPDRGVVRARAGATRRGAPRWAGGRGAGAADRRRSRPPHPPPDGVRSGRDDRLGGGVVRWRGLARGAGDQGRRGNRHLADYDVTL